MRDARWKLSLLAPNRGLAVGRPGPTEKWIDPRGPNGVTILAPYEQAHHSEHPGLVTGDEPKPMQLFDLASDPGEQHDVAARHPDVVKRLTAMSAPARAAAEAAFPSRPGAKTKR